MTSGTLHPTIGNTTTTTIRATPVLDWRVVGLSLFVYLIVSLVVCAALHLAFPDSTRVSVWVMLLRDPSWNLTFADYVAGIAEAAVLAAYTAVVFCPIYNTLSHFFGGCRKNVTN